MSDTLIASLNDRVARLEREKAELQAEKGKHISTKKKAMRELDTLRRQVEDLTKARDEWKGKAEAAPGDQAKRITELEGQIRRRDHKDVFAAALAGQLNEKVTVDDLWSKIGYEPGEKLPAADQLKELIGKARDAAPYLFAPEGGQAQGQAAQTQPAAPPWAGRGIGGQSEGPVTLTEAQLRDPAFMLSNQAKKLLASAS